MKPVFCELIKNITQHSHEQSQTTEIPKQQSEITTSEEEDINETQTMLPEDTRQEGKASGLCVICASGCWHRWWSPHSAGIRGAPGAWHIQQLVVGFME
jgi:hypothetical protein